MKKLAFALLLGSVFSIDATAQSPARVWTYEYLLATAQTERELAPIAEHLVQVKQLHMPALTDFAAEVLLARVSEPGYPLQNKVRLISVLGVEKGARYTAVLAQVLRKTKDRTLTNAARAAMSRDKTAIPAYVPGTIDIHSIVKEVEAAALAAKPTTAQAMHLAAFPGGTIDQLFDWAGRPQQIVSSQLRVGDGIINVKVQHLSFMYRGLGRVIYDYSTAKGGWLYQLFVADPLAFEQEFSYRDRAQELGLPDDPTLEMIQLVSGYSGSIRNVVELNYQRETRPLEFMDTAAEILATQFRSASDPFTVDMYAWICRLLTMHGGQRYAAILKRVAAETPSSKLRRFAQLPIEPTDEVPAEPYLPGAISLAAQREKYPSLYPDSTLTNGRL